MFNPTHSIRFSGITRFTRSFLTRSSSCDPKIVTAEEAVEVVPSGARIYLHGVACTPQRLLKALSKRENVSDIEFCHLHLEGDNPCYSRPESFRTSNFFIGKSQRPDVAAGNSSYIPVFLSEIGKLMRDGLVRPDVAFIQVSPPDKHGYVSLGPEVAASLAAVETSKLVIAQINCNMPRTWGRSNIPYQCLDYVVPDCDDLLYEGHATPLGPVERKIGENIANLVPNGATLQMGIGAIPDAVLGALMNHKNLGIHTEMLGEGFLPLLRSGAVDNSKKKYTVGRSLASFALGSRALYDFLDDNPAVFFDEANITNDPSIISKNDNVVAVNSAVEMDITGQACADSVGTRMLSGVGGQLDFIRGAALSSGGVPILCFPSTSKSGESKIVSVLKSGAGVVTTRPHIHYVVTEYGAVLLRGLNLQQRAKALISIAHPKHRERLEKEAFERYSIRSWQK